jgi:hypothetical protein
MRAGIRFVCLEDPQNADFLVDLDDRLKPFMQDRCWEFMMIRPDFYIYGGASGARALHDLVSDWLADMAELGMFLARRAA